MSQTEIAKRAKEIYAIAKSIKDDYDVDIFRTGSLMEVIIAEELGHKWVATNKKADAIDKDGNLIEYKSTSEMTRQNIMVNKVNYSKLPQYAYVYQVYHDYGDIHKIIRVKGQDLHDYIQHKYDTNQWNPNTKGNGIGASLHELSDKIERIYDETRI